MATSNFTTTALSNWQSHPFYEKALVLGIDIGLSYIGLHLRLGREALVGETVVYSARDSLAARRLKRHWRRNRRGQNQRIFQFRHWCARFNLPWFPLAEWPQRMEPAFRLRLQGEEQPGSLRQEELVVALRHILMRRGYDWHRFLEGEGTFPWGDAAPMSSACRQWLQANYIDQGISARLLALCPAGDEAENKQRAEFEAALADAVAHSADKNLLVHLRQHAASPFAVRARGGNYPREMLEAHAENLLRSHAPHLPAGKLDEAIASYLEILNYHRKDEAAQQAHWESKAGLCPFYSDEARAPASDPDVQRFRLLEFLATRRYAMQSRRKSPLPPVLQVASPAVIAWLLQHPEGQADALPGRGELRAAFERRVCPEGMKLSPDSKTLNGDYFSHLRDLLYPRPTSAAKRAALSARAASEWFATATANGSDFDPARVVKALREPSVPGEPSFYDRRREAALAEWFHPHVEFLLGPRAYLLDGKKAPAGQVHGWLNRLLARREIAERLRAAGHSGKPDYVVIEVVGDIPRTNEGRKKIEDEKKERRAANDARIERYHLPKGDENARLRAHLWEQQGGTDKQPARCPMTSGELTGGPLNPDLEIAHIYPQVWGGPFQRDNLFLTRRETNAAMGDLPPARCAGFNEAHLAAMRWPERKRALFVTPWQPADWPDWGMDTRVAQLARQLRDAMKKWLNITGENEFAARVGTVTGYFTAQCRKAWLAGYRKDRADLRNHLYDAMVLASIPPGVGLNSAAHGGIFVTGEETREGGARVPTYRPPDALGPDWRAFDRAHEHDCLVQRPRSSRPKKSRFDESIYGMEKDVFTGADGRPEKGRRLRIREVLTKGGWPVNDAEKWLAAAGKRWPLFDKYFPEHKWRAWLEENARRQQENARIKKAKAGEPMLEPSPLASSVLNAPMRALTVAASKTEFFDALTLVAHEDYGAKDPAERNVALNLYAYTDGKGREKITSRAILHPRLVAAQARWRELGVEVPPVEPLPEGARRIARVRKGELYSLPLRKDGKLAFDKDDKPSYEEAYLRVWCHVTAVKSDGEVEMKLAEFSPEHLFKKPISRNEGNLDQLPTGHTRSKKERQAEITKAGSRLFGLRAKIVYRSKDAAVLYWLCQYGRPQPV